MLQIFLLGLAVGRPSNGFNSVSAAGVLLLIWNPWYLFDVGWQLSMSAALFISAAASLAKNTWRSAAAVSMLVWLVTAPIVAYYFDKLPLAGLFVNVLAVPLFSMIFPAVLICSAPLLLGFVLGPMMEENFRRTLLLSRGEFSVFFTRPLSLGLLIAAAALVAVVALPSIKAKREEAFQEE